MLNAWRLFHKCLPKLGNEVFPILRFVDPYGDTVFNTVQMLQVIPELEQLRTKCGDARIAAVIGEALVLATRCKDEVGLFIRFAGD